MTYLTDNQKDDKTEIIETLLKSSLAISEYYTKAAMNDPDLPISEAIAVTNYLNHTAMLVKELKS